MASLLATEPPAPGAAVKRSSEKKANCTNCRDREVSRCDPPSREQGSIPPFQNPAVTFLIGLETKDHLRSPPLRELNLKGLTGMGPQWTP